MVLHDDEAAFVRAFILPERQDRWLSGLASEKRRWKMLHRLADERDLRADRMTPIERTLASAEAIWTHLARLGAKGPCHVISELEELDARDMPAPQALEECVGLGLGTVLLLIPARLAYYEAESPGKRWILHSTGT
jgi:hypothetical protein